MSKKEEEKKGEAGKDAKKNGKDLLPKDELVSNLNQSTNLI